MDRETGRLTFLMQIEVLDSWPKGAVVEKQNPAVDPPSLGDAFELDFVDGSKKRTIPEDILYEVWGKNDNEKHQHEGKYDDGDKITEDLFIISVTHMAPDHKAMQYLDDYMGDFMQEELIVGMIESGALDRMLSTWIVTEVFTCDYWGEHDSYIADVQMIDGFEALLSSPTPANVVK